MREVGQEYMLGEGCEWGIVCMWGMGFEKGQVSNLPGYSGWRMIYLRLKAGRQIRI